MKMHFNRVVDLLQHRLGDDYEVKFIRVMTPNRRRRYNLIIEKGNGRHVASYTNLEYLRNFRESERETDFLLMWVAMGYPKYNPCRRQTKEGEKRHVQLLQQYTTSS